MNQSARCEGAFIGHAIASKYDPSIYMALNVSESLLEQRKFNGPDILSRHLYFYHTRKTEVGEITKYIYQELLKGIGRKANLSREDFLFDQATIDAAVQAADAKYNGNTAGCGPAQRSYPLAFCDFISDDDLFDYSVKEAKLTHHNPLAGQVAGIVNVICRSLRQGKSWDVALDNAFATPRLHVDVSNIRIRHHRFASPAVETHPAYAPTVLNAALHHVSGNKNSAAAIANAYAKDKHYCTPLVGILTGVRWGIPSEMFVDNINDEKLITLRETATKLNDLSTGTVYNVTV